LYRAPTGRNTLPAVRPAIAQGEILATAAELAGTTPYDSGSLKRGKEFVKLKTK